jgi:hypothetical protein
MAKLLSGTRIYGNATVDTSITVGTNVAAANVVITNASRLGTITSGTWNGSSISTTYTDAKIVSVSNTAPISATTTAGAVTLSLLNSGVSAATYGSSSIIPVFSVDQYGRITGVSNTTAQVSTLAVGNIIPSGNNIQTLGNATNRFKELYISGSTIYLGNIILTDTGGTVQVSDTGGNVVFTGIDTSGFNLSTTVDFPGRLSNDDYGDLNSITADAFGVPLGGAVYDCMEPIGRMVLVDLEVL